MKQINDSGLSQHWNVIIQPNIPIVKAFQGQKKQKSQPIDASLGPDEIRELKKSQEKLTNFLQKLGRLRDTMALKSIRQAFRQDLILSLTPAIILQFTQTRVSKMIKNHKLKKNWGTQDILLLIWILSKYMELHYLINWEDLEDLDWEQISSMIPGSNSEDCQFKWLNLKKNKLGDHLWTQQESILLSSLVKQNGLENWKIIAQKLYTLNKSKKKFFRTAKQCKQRWSCYENPTIKKGQWTEEEDKILMVEVYKAKGMRKWCQISKILRQRTQNAIKNRYKLILEKEAASVPKQFRNNSLVIISNYLQKHNINIEDYASMSSLQSLSEDLISCHNQKSDVSMKKQQNLQTLISIPGKVSAFSQYKVDDDQSLIKTAQQSQNRIHQIVNPQMKIPQLNLQLNCSFLKYFVPLNSSSSNEP